MEEKTFTKLSALVDGEFTVEKVWGFKWKMWDQGQGKMLVSDSYEKGYRKVYQVDTDKGRLDISASQMGNLLEGVCYDGKSDINGLTFKVKSNGKTGMEIRYWLNPTDRPKKPATESQNKSEDEFGPEDMPW